MEKITTENDYVNKIKTLMDELRGAREKVKDLEGKQKKDEKTVKSQFDHMIKLQEKCRELQEQLTGKQPGEKMGKEHGESRDKQIEELRDRVMQAEKNKEILQRANESEVKAARLQRARYEN